MLEGNRIDLSIPSNQNILIKTFNEFFTVDELEQINIRDIHCKGRNSPSNCEGVHYVKDTGKSCFSINCVLNTDVIPPYHYLKLEFSKDGIYNISLECTHNYNNPELLDCILAKAINYSKYKSSKDPNYNRRSIVKNASVRLAKVIPDYDKLIKFRGRIAEDLYLNDLYKNLEEPFKVSFDHFKFNVSNYNKDVLKVRFSNHLDEDYLFIPKTDIGLNVLLLVIDRAVVHLKDEALEKINE